MTVELGLNDRLVDLADEGWDLAIRSGPDELKVRFARELPMWRDVVKIAGIPPQ